MASNVTRYIAAYDTESPDGRCLNACKSIRAVHEQFDFGGTFFIVGKRLQEEGAEYRALLGDVPNFEIASHTYSHVILRDHPFCGITPEQETRERELRLGKEWVEQTFQRPCVGLRPGCGFYNAMRGDKWLLDTVADAGFAYVSSLLWGPETTVPALLTKPFTYAEDGHPDLWELPGHGWHENLLKAHNLTVDVRRILAWPSPMPEAIRLSPITSPEEEFAMNKLFIDRAIALELPYVSLIWHPWSLHRFDPEMRMLKQTFAYVRELGMEATTYEAEWQRARVKPNPFSPTPSRKLRSIREGVTSITRGDSTMVTTTAPETLALHGGPKAFPQMEGQPEPKIGIEEFMSIAERFGFSDEAIERIRSVIDVTDLGVGPTLSKYATSYPPDTKGAAYEALAREKFGVRYALGVSSGTAALHCAMIAAGIGPGTEVIVPAIGFYATAAMVVAAKGVPIFCDVDESLHMDASKLEALITERTVAIAPTHVMGSICDLTPIIAIAKRHGINVIEDCAQSPGGKYQGQLVGTLGDIGCFSISAYKIIGGGEGGLVITNDERLSDRINQFAEAGGLWRKDRFAPPRYEGELFNGTNYRMSELEAAVDVVQLGKLDAIVSRHHTVKMRVLEQLQTFREITPQKLNDPAGEIGYTLRFFPATIELGTQIVEALAAEGIRAGIHGANPRPDWHIYADMFPITLKTGTMSNDQPFERAQALDYSRGLCPVADDLFDRMVSIGLNQWYSPNDCDQIARGINKVLAAYCTQDKNARSWV